MAFDWTVTEFRCCFTQRRQVSKAAKSKRVHRCDILFLCAFAPFASLREIDFVSLDSCCHTVSLAGSPTKQAQDKGL
jgi:hypothetical protein